MLALGEGSDGDVSQEPVGGRRNYNVDVFPLDGSFPVADGFGTRRISDFRRPLEIGVSYDNAASARRFRCNERPSPANETAPNNGNSKLLAQEKIPGAKPVIRSAVYG
jgi:hypothetical protein